MVQQILPPRTHPFTSPVSGNLVRIVESEDGHCVLESSGGAHIEYARITGPEILKLARQGSDLWNGLRRLVELMATREGIDLDVLAKLDHGVAESLALLDATAATFDHNEPEVPNGQ